MSDPWMKVPCREAGVDLGDTGGKVPHWEKTEELRRIAGAGS